MDESNESATEAISPEEAFALLGHDTRIAIVRAFWELENEPASFTELRERVDLTDSGQFNYHLGRLVGTFVRHTEDGYELTFAGRRVVGAILDGTYTKHASIGPFEIDIACTACSGPLEASYEGEAFRIRCSTCEEMISRFDFPPGAIEGRTRAELVETAAYWVQARFLLIVNGVCPNCTGTMTISFDADIEYRDHDVGVVYDCTRCMERATSTVGWALINHPAVVTFFYEHGADVLGEWRHAQLCIDAGSTTIRSEEPWRVGVTISLADDELELVVDEELTVVRERRR